MNPKLDFNFHVHYSLARTKVIEVFGIYKNKSTSYATNFDTYDLSKIFRYDLHPLISAICCMKLTKHQLSL